MNLDLYIFKNEFHGFPLGVNESEIIDLCQHWPSNNDVDISVNVFHHIQSFHLVYILKNTKTKTSLKLSLPPSDQKINAV